MKIAYFSPLHPVKSGISDYSEALLPHLHRFADIDIWVDGYVPGSPEITERFKIFDYLNKPGLLDNLRNYDAILYHIGNNPYYHTNIYDVFLKYGGTVVLHDFVLYYLVTGYFLYFLKDPRAFVDEMEYGRGDRGIAEAYRILHSAVPPLQYPNPHFHPLNRRLIEQAKGIIVHSAETMKMVSGTSKDVSVKKINLIGRYHAGEMRDCRNIRQKYGVKDGHALILSLGYVAPTKRIHKVIQALRMLRERYEFTYVLAGEGDYVAPLIEELEMSNLVRITGFIPREELDNLVACADIVVNLRYPSMGEASITLIDAMTAGKPCLVSDQGWFSELPEGAAVRIRIDEREIENIAEAISYLIDHPDRSTAVGERARAYVLRDHAPAKIAGEYISYIEQTAKAWVASSMVEYEATRISRLLHEIGAGEEDEFIIDSVSRRLLDLITS